MKKGAIKALITTLGFFLFLSACGTSGTENSHTTTIAPTTAEITTEAIESTGATEEITTEGTVESTEQTKAISDDFTYEAVYSGSWSVEGGDKDGFLLVIGRDEIDDFVKLDSQSNEKYSSEWFETHVLLCLKQYHSGCDRAAINRIETGERTMAIFVDIIDDEVEDLYKKQGKDYENSLVGSGHTEDMGATYILVEIDKNGKQWGESSLKAVLLKVREYPSPLWRSAFIDLRGENQ